MHFYHPFQLSQTGRTAVILPTTSRNVRAHPAIVLRLDGDDVQRRDMQLPFPDWVDNRAGFILRSYALTDDTLVIVTASSTGQVLVKVWDFCLGDLRCCREMDDVGEIFVTPDCEFLWTAVERGAESWKGELMDLATFERVRERWGDNARRFLFQGGSTVMSECVGERAPGMYRVDVDEIVGGASKRQRWGDDGRRNEGII